VAAEEHLGEVLMISVCAGHQGWVEVREFEPLASSTPKGGPLRVIALRARIWRPATRNAGLDGLRIHDLRHTAVALWIVGATPMEVAARVGHTSVSFTLDRYGHLYPESDAALRDRLDTLYSAGQRDQDAAVVDLFQERSRPQHRPRTRGTPPALGR
jgi:hypothetical protein